jgi:hypothetical protein
MSLHFKTRILMEAAKAHRALTRMVEERKRCMEGLSSSIRFDGGRHQSVSTSRMVAHHSSIR